MHRLTRLILAGFMALAFATPAHAGAFSFQGLGFLPWIDDGSRANGVSANGAVVVGRSGGDEGGEAFRWTSDGGMVGLGFLPTGGSFSEATGVSADGSVVVGDSDSTSEYNAEGFRWTSSGAKR